MSDPEQHGDDAPSPDIPGPGTGAEATATEEVGPIPESFDDALAELEGIVEAVSEDRVPIDELGRKVARGAALVAACRQQLDATQVEVVRVAEELARLTDTGAGTSAGSDSEDPDRTGQRRDADVGYAGPLRPGTVEAYDDSSKTEAET